MAERQKGTTQALPVGMAPQECIVLADMMQLELGQKATDVIDQLTNNDFEGDFFKLGDTVQDVAINPSSIKVVEGDKNDIRPTLDRVAFSANTMVIDRKREFAFQIRDLERLEDRWNHESAAHALAARKMREADCLDVLNLITTAGNIACIGSFSTPAVDLTTTGGLTPEQKGNKLFRLVNAMKQYLRQKGVIDGEEYKYGANKTVQLRGTASLFVAPGIHTALLNSQYVRYDDVTENVIRDGKYEKFAGLLLNSAVSLDANYADLGVTVDVLKTHPGYGLMILGTKNLVTRAGKVLPPEKMRDQVVFGDNYYGREIYGRMIACPEAAIMAIVKLEDEFTVTAFTNDGLFKQYAKEGPVRENGYPTITETTFPQPANAQYLANNIPAGTYAAAQHTHVEGDVTGLVTDLGNKANAATTLAGYGITDGVTATVFGAHTHTIESKAIDGTNPAADIVLPVDTEEETQGD